MPAIQHELFENKKKRGPKFRTDPAPKGKKQCVKCLQVKPVAQFSKSKDKYDGLYPRCKTCVSESDKAYRVQSKVASWKRRYGLTQEDYWRMFNEQGGVCAICKQPETKKHGAVVMHLCVDHDHTTGVVRGLLCMSCNKMLGHSRENTSTLESAIEYLETHR